MNGSYHPSIWKFIEELKKEKSLNEFKLEQYVAGENPFLGWKRNRDIQLLDIYSFKTI